MRERRAAERYSARLPVEFHCGALVGYGWIMDMSLSGARLAEVSYWPLLGKRLRILLCLDQAKGSMEVPAEVVRYTETEGFAVRFPFLNPNEVKILRMILARIEELSDKQD